MLIIALDEHSDERDHHRGCMVTVGRDAVIWFGLPPERHATGDSQDGVTDRGRGSGDLVEIPGG